MKKFKCDFCGAEIAAEQGKTVFCKKCNCDYSAEEVDKKLKETSEDEFINHSPVDKETQRRIMINNLEKRKNAVEWQRKRFFLIREIVIYSLFVIAFTVALLVVIGFYYFILFLGLSFLALAYPLADADYDKYLKRLKIDSYRPQTRGTYYRGRKNVEHDEKEAQLALDYANLKKGTYYVRCQHCGAPFSITSDATTAVCPHCKKLTIL